VSLDQELDSMAEDVLKREAHARAAEPAQWRPRFRRFWAWFTDIGWAVVFIVSAFSALGIFLGHDLIQREAQARQLRRETLALCERASLSSASCRRIMDSVILGLHKNLPRPAVFKRVRACLEKARARGEFGYMVVDECVGWAELYE
jgi:hypothetical protein